MLRTTLYTVGIAVAAALVLATGQEASAQNIIGLNFTTAGSATPDPQNWNRISAPDGTIASLRDDSGAFTNVGVTFGGNAAGGFVYLSTSTLAPDAVPQYHYDLSGMTGYGFRSNGVFHVEFTGLSPNTPYEYWFVGYRGASAIQNVVTVSDGVSSQMFTQSVTAAGNDGRFIVNTDLSSNTQHFNNLSRMVDSSPTGTLRFDWFGDGQTTVVGAIAIRVIPEPSALIGLACGGLLLLRRRA